MKTKGAVFCTVLGLCISSAASAGSISGNQFLELSDKERGWYFLGALDAMKETRDAFFATSDLDQESFDRIWDTCISGRPIRQHLAIVDSWLQANPSRWHEPVISLIFDAQRESCEALKIEKQAESAD